MKRGFILQVRTSEDKQTKEMLAWVTIGCIPSKMKDGRLYFPKSSDTLISTCAGANRDPDKFKRYKELKVGTLIDVQTAISEYTEKPFINNLFVVIDSPFSESDLYEKKNAK